MVTGSHTYCPARHRVRSRSVRAADLVNCPPRPPNWGHDRPPHPPTPGHRACVRSASDRHSPRRPPRQAPRPEPAGHLGIPHGSDASDTVALIVAELAANAVTHGRVPGRDFQLRLSLVTDSIRIEVTDTRAERHPRAQPATELLDETGRGLLLVDALAEGWEVLDRELPPGKTVRAEVDLPGWLSLSKGSALR